MKRTILQPLTFKFSQTAPQIMKISELIKDLQEAQSKYGDINVEMMYDCEGEILEPIETTGLGSFTDDNGQTVTTFAIIGITVQ